MPLVFGFPNPQNIQVSAHLHTLGTLIPVLLLRLIMVLIGIHRSPSPGINLLRCSLSNFNHVTTISLNQPAYKNYVNYLPAYMHGLITQQKTSIMSPYHALQYINRPLVLSSLPDVVVSFNGVPVAETLDAIRAAGGKEQTKNRQTVYLIPEPSAEVLRIAKNGGAIATTPAFLNSVNMSCLATLSLVRRIASNFLLTHTYPAFKDANHLSYVKEHWITSEETSTKRKRPVDAAGPSKRPRSEVEDGVEPDAMEDVETTVADSDATPADTIIYAVPPSNTVIGWGPVEDLPDGDGIFCRYVSDTQNNKDEKIVTSVIVKYFLGCLGSTGDEAKTMVERIRGDMGIISGTEQGKELAHLYKCIAIGLEGQARIFPVLEDGQYLGCCLMGAGFRIHAYGTTYTPVTNEILREQVATASSHSASIAGIVGVVDDDDVTDGSLKKLTSMMEFRDVLVDLPLSSVDREKVVVLAKGLQFRQKRLPLSSESIVTAFNLIADNTKEIPKDWPIHPSMLFTDNRTHLVWSAFGDLAPTFEFAGGPRIALDKPSNFPSSISARTISLSDALIDLDSLLRNKYFSGTSGNRRSGPFKDRQWAKLDATSILTAMAKAAGAESKKAGKAKEVVAGSSSNVLDDGF